MCSPSRSSNGKRERLTSKLPFALLDFVEILGDGRLDLGELAVDGGLVPFGSSDLDLLLAVHGRSTRGASATVGAEGGEGGWRRHIHEDVPNVPLHGRSDGVLADEVSMAVVRLLEAVRALINKRGQLGPRTSRVARRRGFERTH
jgi:hypothetical protein